MICVCVCVGQKKGGEGVVGCVCVCDNSQKRSSPGSHTALSYHQEIRNTHMSSQAEPAAIMHLPALKIHSNPVQPLVPTCKHKGTHAHINVPNLKFLIPFLNAHIETEGCNLRSVGKQIENSNQLNNLSQKRGINNVSIYGNLIKKNVIQHKYSGEKISKT